MMLISVRGVWLAICMDLKQLNINTGENIWLITSNFCYQTIAATSGAHIPFWSCKLTVSPTGFQVRNSIESYS